MIVAEKEEEEEEEIRKEDEFVDLPKLNSRISPHLEVPMDAKQRRPQGQRLYQFVSWGDQNWGMAGRIHRSDQEGAPRLGG